MTQNGLDVAFAGEPQKTEEALADLRQYLSHETCTTRRQLIRILEERAGIIKAELQADEAVASIISPACLNCREAFQDDPGDVHFIRP